MFLDSGIALHPWTLLFGQIALTAVVIGFSAPGSPLRSIFLLPMVLSTGYYILTAKDRVDNQFQLNFGGSQVFVNLCQYFDTAFVSKWDFNFAGPQPREAAKKERSPYGPDGLWQRVKFGLYAAVSFRCSGTPFETRGLQQFSKADPSYVPSNRRYLAGAFARLAVQYLLLDALTSLGDPDVQAELFAEYRIPLLSRLQAVSGQELVDRAVTSFIFWFINYLVLSTAVTAFSIIAIVTGMSTAAWWKPLFNFRNGFPFTVRRFWSHFWHLSIKNRIYAPSTFLIDRVLKLRRGSFASRYATLFATFVLSVAMHGLGDIASGIPPNKTGAPSFFLAQAGAIVVEDAVINAWQRWRGSSSERAPGVWQIWVGRLWVLVFMYWCTPFYAYPVTAHNGDGMVVPFSIMRRIFKRSAALGAVAKQNIM